MIDDNEMTHPLLNQTQDDNVSSSIIMDSLNDFLRSHNIARNQGYRFNKISIDNFLIRVYNYYNGKGFYCIILNSLLHLVGLFFLVFYSIFLLVCVDYTILFETHDIYDAINLHGFRKLSPFFTLCLVVFTITWISEFFKFIFSFKSLLEIRRFYLEKLKIGDLYIKTIEWNKVVDKIIKFDRREGLIYDIDNHLDVHNILCRIMRKDNFFIAMIDHKILNNRIWLPFMGKRNFLSGSLEWNIHKCIYNFIFDNNSQIQSYITNNNINMEQLSKELEKRFKIMAWINFIFFPFIILFQLAYFFFRFFEEIKEHSLITMRNYTKYARWQFKEYNELPHLFEMRLNLGYKSADEYVKNFPQPILVIISRFIIFILSSFIAVLTCLTLYDEKILFYPLTKNRTVLWYVGIFGIIIGICRSCSFGNYVFEPIKKIKAMAVYTHYYPDKWKGKEYTYSTYESFLELFTYKIYIIFDEIISVILTPYILYFNFSPQSYEIIKFFTNNIVYDDNIGYHCSFSDEKNLELSISGTEQVDYLGSTKLRKSFLNYKHNYNTNLSNPSINEKYNSILDSVDEDNSVIKLGLSMLFLESQYQKEDVTIL